ncbi:MAG: T9SS type A sorting domain-containing protein [Bacteroidota bacterium]
MYYVKRIVFAIVAVVVFIGTTYSQSITTEVFASSGMDFKSDNSSLSWTLGENFIETFEISTGIQTLGFHQTFFKTTQVEPQLMDINLRVYPNPFSQHLYIHSTKESDKMHVQIFNSLGEKVFDQKIYQTNSYQLNLSELTDGIYYLKIISEKTKNFKIIKLSN